MTDGTSAAADEKAVLRERMLAARAALPPARRAEAAAAITRRLRELPELAGARSLLGYAAFGAEVDLGGFLSAAIDAGLAVHLPWVDGEDLRLARVADLEADLAPGWGGVPEPLVSLRQAAEPALDAVLVPGVAFDLHGGRVGYGGGHFDRLLARLPRSTVVVGVGYDVQLVDAVPVEAHDVTMDAVVTETRTARAGAATGPP